MAEPEFKIRRAPRLDGDSADKGRVRSYYDDDTVDLAPYILAICVRWRTIVAFASAVAALTAIITGFVLHKWYRATAVIRPISTPAVESRIAGVMGALGGGLGGLGGLTASIGAAGNNDADEYIAILRGFQFNVTLAEKHQLSTELLRPGPLSFLDGSKDLNWKVYRILKKRFDCEYSTKTGNITLSFEARDRQKGDKVLGYYVDDLRDLLRAREVESASSAIESLEAEASSTPDAVLRTELYGLIAKQVQRRKMAQVEADFAFRVLDPPAASDTPYRPSVLLDSMLALVLTAVALSFATIAACGRASI